MSVYERPDLFFLFGDSITQQSNNVATGFSFASSIQDDFPPSPNTSSAQYIWSADILMVDHERAVFIRQLDVLNRGFSGYNTTQALEILPRIIPSPECARIKYMTIFFGANDACLTTSGTSQHVALGKFKENLSRIINHPFIAKHKPRIILITPPPVDEYMRFTHQNTKGNVNVDRTALQTAQYAHAAREVGMQSKIAILDVWSIFMQLAGWRLGDKILPGSKDMERKPIFAELLSDGLHLNNLGYRILFTSLMNLIKETWPNDEEHDISFVLPAWNDKAAWTNLSSN